MRHYLIVFLLVMTVACQPTNNSSNQTSAFQDVDVTAASDLIKNEGNNLVILDVRTADEVAQGNIANHIHLDFYKDDFEAQLGKLDKSKNTLVYCRSGGRSKKAQKLMEKLGFKKVYNLKGGYTAWDKAKH